jgi:hypothetical protein
MEHDCKAQVQSIAMNSRTLTDFKSIEFGIISEHPRESTPRSERYTTLVISTLAVSWSILIVIPIHEPVTVLPVGTKNDRMKRVLPRFATGTLSALTRNWV